MERMSDQPRRQSRWAVRGSSPARTTNVDAAMDDAAAADVVLDAEAVDGKVVEYCLRSSKPLMDPRLIHRR